MEGTKNPNYIFFETFNKHIIDWNLNSSPTGHSERKRTSILKKMFHLYLTSRINKTSLNVRKWAPGGTQTSEQKSYFEGTKKIMAPLDSLLFQKVNFNKTKGEKEL